METISVLYKCKLILKAVFRASALGRVRELKKYVLWQEGLIREESFVAF